MIKTAEEPTDNTEDSYFYDKAVTYELFDKDALKEKWEQPLTRQVMLVLSSTASTNIFDEAFKGDNYKEVLANYSDGDDVCKLCTKYVADTIEKKIFEPGSEIKPEDVVTCEEAYQTLAKAIYKDLREK